jgi:alkaline phosphatase D
VHDDSSDAVSRRRFLAASALALPIVNAALVADAQPPAKQATGVKVGEITDSSAIVWTRLTANSARNDSGVVIAERSETPPTVPVHEIEGACPGAAGRVRVRYGTARNLDGARETAWADVTAATDYTQHFSLLGLEPGTPYYFEVETAGPGGTPEHAPLAGRFATAPRADAASNLTFCVTSCQGYPDRDHRDGHNIYPSMLALDPSFVCLTGDVVYYDNDPPSAVTAELARLHWQRMFSLPRQRELLRNAGSYWLKDDHDTLKNDTWPGQQAGALTFAEGQRIFREQTPTSEQGYRTFRWGRDLRLWLTDGRDHHSPNTIPDGPDKTIWGADQKQWFKRTVAASDATWRVLVSPTPLVGPDRPNSNDNHSNAGFAHEGNELREWLRDNAPENFFVVCGDRHWQYHSVHPTTRVQDAGGSPGEDAAYHKFHRVQGGFLAVTLARSGNRSTIVFEHRDVLGAVVYRWEAQREVAA